jgi:hypothetical protein
MVDCQEIFVVTKVIHLLSAQEIENAAIMHAVCIMEKAIAVLRVLQHASF